jgi:putative transposase
MPWAEQSVMDQRLSFIAACLRQEEAMSQLCLRHGISRKTGYKWLSRYREAGVVGLADLSSVPRTLAQTIDPAIVASVLALRDQRPTWGPRKLLVRLRIDDPGTTWPAASTVGDLLRREKRSTAKRRKPADPRPALGLIEASAPNESWSADFKGWFRTADGVRCEPFTVTDGYSRYLLACEAVAQATVERVRPILARLFQDHGLPRALRTDNGTLVWPFHQATPDGTLGQPCPFARRDGLGGLTQLSVWLLKLTVWPDRIEPGRPDQNGRHEWMHRVLREDAANPPAATLDAQRQRMDAWRMDYNTQRPHEALGQRCPATLYTASSRAYPATIKDWDYPADHQIRRVVGDRSGASWAMAILNGEMARCICPEPCAAKRLVSPAATTATGRSGSVASIWRSCQRRVAHCAGAG